MSSRAAGAPRSHAKVLAGLGAFIATMAAAPYFIHRRTIRLQNGEQLLTKDEPLPAHAVRRGAFTNSGSRDAGADPDWDLVAKTYKGKAIVIQDESTPC